MGVVLFLLCQCLAHELDGFVQAGKRIVGARTNGPTTQGLGGGRPRSTDLRKGFETDFQLTLLDQCKALLQCLVRLLFLFLLHCGCVVAVSTLDTRASSQVLAVQSEPGQPNKSFFTQVFAGPWWGGRVFNCLLFGLGA